MTTPNLDFQTLDQLRSFCRGEMSAVESYTAALLDGTMRPYAPTLSACRESHRTRVRRLRQIIEAKGGRAPQSSGVWGAVTEAMEGAAATVGPKGTLFALSEGEDHGLRDYLSDLPKLTTGIKGVLEREIVPAQRETRRAIAALRSSIQA
jgi:hypothetical protein